MYFVFYDTATTEFYTYGHTLALHDAVPILIFRAIHLSFAVALVLLLHPVLLRDGRRKFIWYDALMFAGTALAVGHLFVNYSYFVNRFIYIDDLTQIGRAHV